MDATRNAFNAGDFTELLLRKFYPERTDRESGVIRDFLLEHIHDYDRLQFSVRIGEGMTPNPDHLPAVQRNTVFGTQKRIDMLAWSGSQPTIVEVKERVTPASLGQILTYRQLFREDNPVAEDPIWVVIGRYSDEDTLRSLTAHGVTVFLYPPADAGGNAGGGGV
jgi:hypothetical protein